MAVEVCTYELPAVCAFNWTLELLILLALNLFMHNLLLQLQLQQCSDIYSCSGNASLPCILHEGFKLPSCLFSKTIDVAIQDTPGAFMVLSSRHAQRCSHDPAYEVFVKMITDML